MTGKNEVGVLGWVPGSKRFELAFAKVLVSISAAGDKEPVS